MTELLCNLAAIRGAVQPRLFGDSLGLDVISTIGRRLPISVADFLHERRSDLGVVAAV
jgi:hypothetical protein